MEKHERTSRQCSCFCSCHIPLLFLVFFQPVPFVFCAPRLFCVFKLESIILLPSFLVFALVPFSFCLFMPLFPCLVLCLCTSCFIDPKAWLTEALRDAAESDAEAAAAALKAASAAAATTGDDNKASRRPNTSSPQPSVAAALAANRSPPYSGPGGGLDMERWGKSF